MSQLLYEVENGVAYLTMNRPEARNALSLDMRTELCQRLEQLEADDSVRCVVLRGAGEHFLAGGDVRAFMEFTQLTAEERRRTFTHRIHQLHLIMFAMRRLAKPVIASVQGAAAGAGVSLALCCDLVIAAEDAFFTLAYSKIGASPDGSASYYLPRVVGAKKAMEMALLADRYSASEARELGMINWVVPNAELKARTRELAERLARGPTRAFANTKRLLQQSLNTPLEAQLQAEAELFGDSATSDDWVEGVRAFNEKRTPEFNGH
ncbi:enoyl-CoA hydratase/isomerase family protein [Marinobacter sp. SS21]|uniref:enoyl-CoA hydratase/isomerase family protein n=1 Tax=Marinobacter sp. SS21 TaxID=2979460 RepID=UPI00232EFBBE|nr:enoyl-CoA hydratase [Marinobacter sp. SS21]MDC0662969.1 enoyl-CoA hydratase [Marinobacter sp. SS21]